MLNGKEYVVTVKDNKSDEAYLSVIIEDVAGGKVVKVSFKIVRSAQKSMKNM